MLCKVISLQQTTIFHKDCHIHGVRGNVPEILINIENQMVLQFLQDCFVHSSTHSERSIGMKI